MLDYDKISEIIFYKCLSKKIQIFYALFVRYLNKFELY